MKTYPLKNPVLMRAVEMVGGQTALANQLNLVNPENRITQRHIWSWLYRSGVTPAEYCYAISQITQNKVPCHELRPNVFPAPRSVAA